MTVIQKWLEFSGKVTAFGENDGFAAIHTACSSESQLPGILEAGWIYYPPHHHVRIEQDGNITDINKETIDENEAFEKMSKEEYRAHLLKEQMNPDPDFPLIVVEAKATLNSVDATYNVRTGFWTRIESKDIDAAIELTIKLWEEEHARTPEEREKLQEEFEAAYFNDVKRIMARMRNDASLDPLLDKISFDNEVGDGQFVLSTPPRQLWWIARFIHDLEKDIAKVRKLFKGRITDEQLLSFINDIDTYRENVRQNNKEGNNHLVSVDDMFEAFEREAEMVENFLKNWKPK